jgi:hypothetical protein
MTPTLHRVLPLAGCAYAALVFAADLTIGPFPDGETSAARLPSWYAAHGSHVGIAGTLVGIAALCFAVFGVAVWERVRRSPAPPAVAAVVLVGTAVQTLVDGTVGGVYRLLGHFGAGPVDPAAVQSWHLAVAEYGMTAGATLVLLGIAAGGIGYRAVPRWLGCAALLLVAAQFSPWGFLVSLVFLAFVAVAGATLAVRPGARVVSPGPVPEPVG